MNPRIFNQKIRNITLFERMNSYFFFHKSKKDVNLSARIQHKACFLKEQNPALRPVKSNLLILRGKALCA